MYNNNSKLEQLLKSGTKYNTIFDIKYKMEGGRMVIDPVVKEFHVETGVKIESEVKTPTSPLVNPVSIRARIPYLVDSNGLSKWFRHADHPSNEPLFRKTAIKVYDKDHNIVFDGEKEEGVEVPISEWNKYVWQEPSPLILLGRTSDAEEVIRMDPKKWTDKPDLRKEMYRHALASGMPKCIEWIRSQPWFLQTDIEDRLSPALV